MLEASAQVLEALGQMNRAGQEGKPFFFALDYELAECILWLDPMQQPAPIDGLCFRVGEVTSSFQPRCGEPPQIISVYPEGEAAYSARFDVVYRGLERGDSFLTNLTLRTPIELRGSLSDVYAHTRARYQVLCPGRFVCFSPECFVRISAEGVIRTYPMKGTIAADLPDAATRLLTDYKEGAEHYTIVDLMRNDLNQVAERTRVERFKYLERLSTSRGDIFQMSSEVVAKLPEGWRARLGDTLRALLPAGSISGAPKAKTCEIIRQAEGAPRGFYTGICGYFDGAALEAGVLIRFIEQDGAGRLYYRSGGGITINSERGDEYRECLQKIYLPLASDL